MYTLGLLALFFTACLVFYFVGRRSGSSATPTTPVKLPVIPDKILDAQKMLPALRRLPPGELGIIKLTVGLMAEVGREGKADPIQRAVTPMELFQAVAVKFISELQLPSNVLEQLKQSFGMGFYPNVIGMCFNNDTRADLSATIELFGSSEADAEMVADWCFAVADTMSFRESLQAKEFADTSRALIEMAVSSADSAEFVSLLRSSLKEEYSSGESEFDKSSDAPELARTVWETEAVRLSRECLARLRLGTGIEEVEQWLRDHANSPFTYAQVACAIRRSDWENVK